MLFKYNWEKYPEVKNILNKIYVNTLDSIGKEYTDEFLSYIEDFLHYLEIYNYNFNKIIKLLSEIDMVGFQENIYISKGRTIIPNYKNMPPVINLGNKILLNPVLEGDCRLSVEERRRLYLYHGLANTFLSFKSDKTKAFSELYSDILGEDKFKTEAIVNHGWYLLEEVIAQELAERATYELIDKERPKKRYGLEYEKKFPLHDSDVYSNLEFYRMFQIILLNFGVTLSKIGCQGNCNITLMTFKLLKKAINTNFSDDVISEYIIKENETELYILLYLMGLLMNEKYATYGLRPIPDIEIDIEEVHKVYDSIYKITTGLIDMSDDEYYSVPIHNTNANSNILLKRRILNVVKKHNFDI